MAQTQLMRLERAKPLCCALVGWVTARGRLGISQDPSDFWHIYNGWTYSMSRNLNAPTCENASECEKNLMWKGCGILLSRFLFSYSLLVAVQCVKSDSYICVDKFPVWNRSEPRHLEPNCMSDLFMCTMALWHTAAITDRMSCYMWHEWYRSIFPCWHDSAAQT